jgi:hypothetical protein
MSGTLSKYLPRFLVTAFLAAAGVMLLQIPHQAWACSSSTQYCSRNYNGLKLYHDNDTSEQLLAEVRTSTTLGNYGVKNFQSSQGDLEEMHAVLIDRAADGDGVYISWGRWNNGYYCYTSHSTSVTANVDGPDSFGGAVGSTSSEVCGTGWHGLDAIRGSNIGTADGAVYKEWDWAIDGTASTMRMRTRPCRDENLSPDTCLSINGDASGRYAGISY